MISEEFLSEILNTKVLSFKYIKDDDRKFRKEVFLIADNEGIYDLSPEELENKGKQWANNKGFRIIEIDTDLFWVIPKKYNISYSFSYGMVLSKHNTFFKACQWILDNKSGSSE